MSRLEGLHHRSTDGKTVQFYSRFVRIIRYVLPLVMIVIVAGMIAWSQLSDIDFQPLSKQDLKDLQKAEAQNQLLEPSFQTQDSSGRPIRITATQAVQDRDAIHRVILKNPQARFEDDQVMTLRADQGVYNQKTEELLLIGGVNIRYGDDLVLSTETLQALIADNILKGDQPARLDSDRMTVTGSGVTLRRLEETLIFHGPVRAVILL